MKRFKTKQEFTKKDKVEHISLFRWMGAHGLFGLKEKHDPDRGYTSLVAFTADPHPFDSIDIKVRVTPKQSKKLQKKSEKMGYRMDTNLTDANTRTMHGLGISNGKVQALCHLDGEYSNSSFFDAEESTELTYKQFMNGTVPKKKEFKVGDWVEVIKSSYSKKEDRDVGDICQITLVETRGCLLKGHYKSPLFHTKDEFKHTTKPKDHPITADEIIKPEVMERLKEVTIMSIKACKSIKDVEEAYTSLQNTIKEL